MKQPAYEAVIRVLEKDTLYLLALLLDKSVVGEALFRFCPKYYGVEDKWWLRDIRINEEWKGQSHGSVLLECACYHMQRLQVAPIYLKPALPGFGTGETLEEMREAIIAWYSRHGFVSSNNLLLMIRQPDWQLPSVEAISVIPFREVES